MDIRVLYSVMATIKPNSTFFYSYIIRYILFFIKYIFVLINRLFLIDLPRNTQYIDGLNKFLDFAFSYKSIEGKIIYPYSKCNLNKSQTRGATYEHLILHPFPKGYTFWLLHGETNYVQHMISISPIFQSNEDKGFANDPICGMVNDAF